MDILEIENFRRYQLENETVEEYKNYLYEYARKLYKVADKQEKKIIELNAQIDKLKLEKNNVLNSYTEKLEKLDETTKVQAQVQHMQNQLDELKEKIRKAVKILEE